MGLFNKLKNVLFEEEEVEIPVITKKTEEEEVENSREQRYNPPTFTTEQIDLTPSRDNISKFRNVKRDIEVDSSSDDVKTQEIPLPNEEDSASKSPFLSFDEDEFERVNSRIKENEEKQEKHDKQEKKQEEKQPKKTEESKRVETPKRFKPSPVISPVYGILDKNYKKEDITLKGTEPMPIYEEVSVETVRKKAFGTLVDDIESTLGEEINIKKEEKEDERSIDEILTESIDETISLDEEIEIPLMNSDNSSVEDQLEDALEEDVEEDISMEIEEPIKEEKPVLDNAEIELPTFEDLTEDNEEEEISEESSILEKTDTIKMLDEIGNELNDVKANKELLEDTTETDLFNLIDSMYENREEDK